MIRWLIILLLIVGCGTEPEDVVIPSPSTICENNFSEVDGSLTSCGSGCLEAEGGCYLQNDIDVLADIIELDSLDIPYLQLGSQSWIQGRLISLDVSNVYPNLDTLPNTISNLTALTSLDLSSNSLTTLPNTICDIYDSLATKAVYDSTDIGGKLGALKLTSNSICPPYPECITDEDLDYQYQNDCESMGCMDNTACNYDGTVLYSYLNDTCWDANEGCDCSNNPTNDNTTCEQDCAGVWGGDAVELWEVCYNIEETTELDLYANQLTGSIPPEIGNLTNLTHLYLDENQLTGEIPSEIGNLTNLTDLRLNNNQLTGEIPQEVCALIESNNLNMDYILVGNNLTNTCE